MADDQNNQISEHPTAEKPKRTRKRKTEAEMLQPIDASAETQIDAPSAAALADVSNTESSVSEVTPIAPESSAPVANEASPDIDAPLIAEPMIHEAPVHLSGCGGALKAAREARGYSIAEVCKHLRLSPNQIQAMEKDDFEKLPQKTIVRGFIRNYAKLLKIEAEPILAAYQAMMPESRNPSTLTVKSNADHSVIQAGSTPKRSIRMFNPLVILLVLSLLTYFYVVHIKPQSLTTATQTLEASPEDNQETSIPVAIEPSNPSETPAETPEANLNVKPEETPPPEPVIAQAAATAAATQSESNNSTVNTAQSENKVLLVFRVTEDSWVRIEDAQGKKVFSQIITPGNEQSMTLEKPLNITVGNASVTKLSIDNQPFDLSQATKGRVARVQLK